MGWRATNFSSQIMLPSPPVHVYVHVSYKGKSHMCYATPTITVDKSVWDHIRKISMTSLMCCSLPCNMGTIHPYCTHGDHPSLLYTWGPSIPIVHRGTTIPIVHMGTIHPYCTHGDHPSLYMGTIHPYCTHGDHPSLLYIGEQPSLLYTWGPSIPIVHRGTTIPIVHMGTIHPYCTHGDHPSLLYT